MGYLVSLLLIGLALLMLVLLIRNQIPNLMYMMIFLIIYYNGQLGILHFVDPQFLMDFAITSYAKNDQYALQQLLFLSATICVFVLGWYSSSTSTIRTTIAITKSNTRRIVYLAVGLMIVCASLLILLSRQGFFGGYDDPDPYKLPSPAVVMYLTLVKVMAILLAILVGFYIALRKRMLLVLAVLALIFYGYSAAKSGKRLEVLMSSLAVLLLFYIVFLKVFWRVALIATGMFGLVIIGLSRLGITISKNTVLTVPLLEGFYSNHTFTGYYSLAQNDQLKYQGFMPWVKSVAAFIPRFIWPSKEAVLYTGYGTDIKEVSPLGGGSLVADFYAQGGSFWCLICFFGLGFFLRKMQIQKADLEFLTVHKRYNAQIIYYTITATFFMMHMRDGFVTCVKSYLQLMAAAWFFLLLLKRFQWAGISPVLPANPPVHV